jgi:hypothetical protein
MDPKGFGSCYKTNHVLLWELFLVGRRPDIDDFEVRSRADPGPCFKALVVQLCAWPVLWSWSEAEAGCGSRRLGPISRLSGAKFGDRKAGLAKCRPQEI